LYKREAIIVDQQGIHARPAAKFVKIASQFKSDIVIEYNGKSINTKSIMGVLASGIKYNEKIMICADGSDEKEAVEALINLLNHINE
jgi:phosphocarrier protein